LARQQPKSINLICVPRREKHIAHLPIFQQRPKSKSFNDVGGGGGSPLWGRMNANERRWEMSREIITLDGSGALIISRVGSLRGIWHSRRARVAERRWEKTFRTQKTAFLSECIPQIFVSGASHRTHFSINYWGWAF
jgi:hypothetical protein